MILDQLTLGPLPQAPPVGIKNKRIPIRDAGPERTPKWAAKQSV